MTYSIGNSNKVKISIGLNTVIVTKVKTKSINYITLSTIALNNLRGVAVRLGAVNVCGE